MDKWLNELKWWYFFQSHCKWRYFVEFISRRWTTFCWVQMESRWLWKWKLLGHLEAPIDLKQGWASLWPLCTGALPALQSDRFLQVQASLLMHRDWTWASLLYSGWSLKSPYTLNQIWFTYTNTNFISSLHQFVNLLENNVWVCPWNEYSTNTIRQYPRSFSHTKGQK